MSDNNFGSNKITKSTPETNGLILAKILHTHLSTLKYLNLRDDNLGDDAIYTLFDLFQSTTTPPTTSASTTTTISSYPLYYLDLSGNDLKIRFAIQTLKIIANQFKQISQLFLDDNDEILINPDDEDEDDEEDDEDILKEKKIIKYVSNTNIFSKELFEFKHLTLLSVNFCELTNVIGVILCQ